MLFLADAPPPLETSTILARLGLAMLFGGLVGIDRQMHHKPAGLRTLMLVSLGACTFMMVPLLFRLPDGAAMTTADASRVIQGIVGGIGFLGAGVIMHSGVRHAGITTAAATWVTAGVGVAIGAGEWVLGIAAGVAALFTLSVVGRIEYACFPHDEPEPQSRGGPLD